MSCWPIAQLGSLPAQTEYQLELRGEDRPLSPWSSEKSKLLFWFGSAPRVVSSWLGVRAKGAPLFHLPTSRAPRRTGSTPKVTDALRMKLLNSGTNWSSLRNTMNEPLFIQVNGGGPAWPG